MRFCQHCRTELLLEGKIGIKETCFSCGFDLHCCLNCSFHDPRAYNQCRETQAERVVDKEKANYCDFFVFREVSSKPQAAGGVSDARKKLDDLFKSG